MRKALIRRIASITCAAAGWGLFAVFFAPIAASFASSSMLVSVETVSLPWFACLPLSALLVFLAFRISGCFAPSSDILLELPDERTDMPKFSRGLKARRAARRELSDFMSKSLRGMENKYYKVIGDVSKGYVRGISTKTLNALSLGKMEFPAMLTADPRSLNNAASKLDYLGDDESGALTMLPLEEAKDTWGKCFARYEADAGAVLDIWGCVLGGTLIDRMNQASSLQSLGRSLGVDLLIDAYLEGVPLEVLLAGREDEG